MAVCEHQVLAGEVVVLSEDSRAALLKLGSQLNEQVGGASARRGSGDCE